MKALLKNSDWVRAALIRAGRTALVTLASYTTLGGGFTEVDWVMALSATAVATLLSIATSLGNLPEVQNKNESKLLAVFSRGVKSFFQNVIAFIPASAVFLSDIDFVTMMNVSALAGVGSILLGIVSHLPEEEKVDVEDLGN